MYPCWEVEAQRPDKNAGRTRRFMPEEHWLSRILRDDADARRSSWPIRAFPRDPRPGNEGKRFAPKHFAFARQHFTFPDEEQ